MTALSYSSLPAAVAPILDSAGVRRALLAADTVTGSRERATLPFDSAGVRRALFATDTSVGSIVAIVFIAILGLYSRCPPGNFSARPKAAWPSPPHCK